MARGLALLNDVGIFAATAHAVHTKDRARRIGIAAAGLRECAGRMRNGPILLPAVWQREATAAMGQYDHGSPLWRLLVCIASGRVTREDLRILAEVVEALNG